LVHLKAFTRVACAAQAPQVLSDSGHSPVKILTAAVAWLRDNNKIWMITPTF
jgi:hypothetical protein